jgi:hypothetical protein
MADFTKNVTNPVRVFAGGGASLWGVYNWNAFLWGEGTVEFRQDVVHVYSNSIPVTQAFAQKDVVHYMDANTITCGDQFIKHARVDLSNSCSVSSETTSETLRDGSGYAYVFTSDTIEAEDRDTAVWASAAGGSNTWTSAAGVTTTWS